ncbi:hypothetical protein [Methylomicrobium sp. Wu6]|nr:hypothetical protein [Methylomicrobium sp. Wu6]MEC4747341.1 hypothetical protein [Methylomicrobium sp. Wu6]
MTKTWLELAVAKHVKRLSFFSTWGIYSQGGVRQEKISQLGLHDI